MVIGICVKSKTTGGEKVFLNICVSDKIPPPEDVSDTKLFELLSDEVPAYTIPMSIGTERMEVDKCNKNPSVFRNNVRTKMTAHI